MDTARLSRYHRSMHPGLLAAILSLMPYVDAPRYAAAITNAILSEPQDDRPSPELVVAVIYTESRGLPKVCATDRFGGSNRGLMQVRVPHSTCEAHRSSGLFDVETNIVAGVHILAELSRFERTVHLGRHDVLDHYAGYSHLASSGSSPYARRVREIERGLVHGNHDRNRTQHSSGSRRNRAGHQALRAHDHEVARHRAPAL